MTPKIKMNFALSVHIRMLKKIAVLLYTEIKAQNFLRSITMQYGIVNGHSTYFHEFFFSCIVWKRSVQLNIFSFQRQYLEEAQRSPLSAAI